MNEQNGVEIRPPDLVDAHEQGIEPDRDVDQRIIELLENTEQISAQVHVIAAEQTRLVGVGIERQRIDVKSIYDNQERAAHARLQEVIENARLEHRRALSLAADGRERATASIDKTEEQAAYFFAVCRNAAERIYTGKALHTDTYEALTTNIATAERELEDSEALIARIQTVIAENDRVLASNEGLVMAYDGSIRDQRQEQVRLHAEDRERANKGLQQRAAVYDDTDDISDPSMINARMSEMENMGSGYGGELIYTVTSLETLQQLNVAQNIINAHTEQRDELIEEMARIREYSKNLSTKWKELTIRRTELHRYLDALRILKLQLVEELTDLNDQAEILASITGGGIEQLEDVPYDLMDVLSAAHDLLARRTDTSQINNPINIGQTNTTAVRVGDVADIARKYLVSENDVAVVFSEGDSIDEARAAISHTTAKFGLPPALRETFAKVAEHVQVSPRAFRPGMQLRVAIEPSHQG